MVIISGIITKSSFSQGSYGKDKGKSINEIFLKKVIPKIQDSSTHKRTLKHENFEIHYSYVAEKKLCFCCGVEEGTKKRVAWNFLNEIEEKYSQLKDPSTGEVKSMIKSTISFYNDPQNDKITHIQNKVDEIKEVMIENIEEMVSKNEKIENIDFEANELQEETYNFAKGAKKVKKAQYWVFCLLIFVIIITLCLCCFVILVLLIIVLIPVITAFVGIIIGLVFLICGSNFENCRAK